MPPADEAPDGWTLAGVHESEQEARGQSVASRPRVAQGVANALGLQVGELPRQHPSLRRGRQEPLAPVFTPFPLLDEPLIDELLEDPSERLLGDAEDVEELGDGEAGMTVYEVQDAVMRSPESVAIEKLVGIGHEIAVGEEEELDHLVERLRHFVRSAPVPAGQLGEIYVSHIDIF